MANEGEVEQYRQLARDIRELAGRMHRAELKERTLAIAAEYEQMADQIARGEKISN